MIPLFFTALHYLIPAIHTTNLDKEFIVLDFLVTGTYPTVWIEKFNFPLLTEIMQISYSSFYFLPLIILIYLARANEPEKLERVLSLILLGFYSSYLGYLLFPALGPRYFLAHMQSKSLTGLGLYEWLNRTLNGLENIQWDAFPSGHITIILIFSYFAFLYKKAIFYSTLPIVVLLIISTVYLRYHYVVDLISGIILFLILVLVDRKFNQFSQ